MKKAIETKSGYKCTIDPEKLDDMRVVELLAEMDDSPVNISVVLDLVMGEKQRKALYKHVTTKDGRIPITAIESIFAEIVEELSNADDTAKK